MIYQFGRGISKMVGPKKQDFWTRINILTKIRQIKKKKNHLSIHINLGDHF